MSSVSVQYSVFASILAIGAMTGGLTSGHISNFIGRKGVSYKWETRMIFTGQVVHIATSSKLTNMVFLWNGSRQ